METNEGSVKAINRSSFRSHEAYPVRQIDSPRIARHDVASSLASEKLHEDDTQSVNITCK
jgi:hypothetical protein